MIRKGTVWEVINDFPNYKLNQFGQVMNVVTGKLKKNTLGANGYYVTVLYNESKAKTVAIHRLLALHFIDNPNNYPIVNHKDGNKQNIDLENLEWSTYSENNQHAYDTGLKKMTPQMMEHARKLHQSSILKNPHGANSKAVIAVKGEIVIPFPSVEVAAKTLGMHRCSIDRVLNGKRKISMGYTFYRPEDEK